jgi:hypothetical protein
LGFGKPENGHATREDGKKTVEVAKELLVEEEKQSSCIPDSTMTDRLPRYRKGKILEGKPSNLRSSNHAFAWTAAGLPPFSSSTSNSFVSHG